MAAVGVAAVSAAAAAAAAAGGEHAVRSSLLGGVRRVQRLDAALLLHLNTSG